jgi:hypothetical protein
MTKEILLRTKYVPSLVKIHWRMLILECSQGCYAVTFWLGYLDLWLTGSNVYRITSLRTIDIVTLPSVRHILVNTLESTSFNGFLTKLGTYLLNSHTVKHANCYGSSHYFLKILFINRTYKIQTKQGQSVAYPLA